MGRTELFGENEASAWYQADPENQAPLDIPVTQLFYENQYSDRQIVINRGGAGSSKSYSLGQLMLFFLLTQVKKKILIARKSLPFLKISTLAMMRDMASEYGIFDYISEEKVLLNWSYNGGLIHFGSIDDPEKIKCYHPDTFILTIDGFKPISEVKKGELVATMNPETRKVEYRPVRKTYEYKYEGQMLSPMPEYQNNFNQTDLDFCVTPDHTMIYSRRHDDKIRYSKLRDVGHEMVIPISAEWPEGKSPEMFEIQGKSIPLKLWLEFFAWYLTKGECVGDSTVKIMPRNRRKMDNVLEILEKMDLDFVQDTKSFYINSKELKTYLEQFGDREERFIPRELMELEKEDLSFFLSAMIFVNGNVINEDRRTFRTKSFQLINDVCEIAFKIGLSAMFASSFKFYYEEDNPLYVVHIKHRKNGSVRRLKNIEYKGKVYCVDVPPYHNVCTQYHGRIMWCGQSTDWNYIWLEEATEFSFEEFKTIKLRLRTPSHDGEMNRMFLSFNPINEYHWIKTKLIDDPTWDTMEIVSNYRDNPFLPMDYVQALKQLESQDPTFYNIYTLGEWGTLDNIIYHNWEITDKWPDADNMDKVFYGLDFGFNAPTALVEMRQKGREIYEKELIYDSKLTNRDLIERLKSVIPVAVRRRYPIYADSAEPDRIEEIRREGFFVKPGAKNIVDGINAVKSYAVYVHQESGNIIKEKRAYSWRKDKNGNVVDEPVGLFDHAMDAERYGIYTHLKKGTSIRIRELG